MKELNELKHVLSPKAFDAYLSELLKEKYHKRVKPVVKKTTRKATTKKSGK